MVEVYKGEGHISVQTGTVIYRDSECEIDDCIPYRAAEIKSTVLRAGTLLDTNLGNPV